MMENSVLYILLAVILLSASHNVSSVSHSHYFFSTVTNASSEAYPSYYTTRSIDDITLYWYDSDNEVIERRVPWFRSTFYTLLDASIDEYGNQQYMQNSLTFFTKYLNETKGFHILQLLDGCVLYDNGTFDTIYGYHYDGKPFLSFSVEKAKWTTEDPRMQNYTKRLNVNETITEQIKNILVDRCVPHIRELLSLGNCTFNRREKPVVLVTQTPTKSSTYSLNCRAYGHYPKNISMTWYKNGEPVSQSVMERVTLPLPDITYLTWLWLNVTPTDDDVYTCGVTHSSLTSQLMLDWRLPEDSGGSGISNGGIIAICLAVVVLLVLAVFGSVSFAKSRRQ